MKTAPVIFNAAFDNVNALTPKNRTVKAAYAEVSLPIVDMLEVTGAIRIDDYSGFGSTTNPKVAVKFQPADWLMFRGSYSTGFRVPSFNQIFNGITESPYSGSDLADPVKCPGGVPTSAFGSGQNCAQIRPNVWNGGTADLGPETAKMMSLGVVLRPLSRTQLSTFFARLRLFGIGLSWGGYESLITPIDPADLRSATEWPLPDMDPQDRFGVRSQNLAVAHVENGFFEREITPLTLADGTVVSKDDGPRPGTNYEAVSQLKPVFRPDGTVTAGNACPLNDGAAAVVVMSDAKAKALGLTPLARVVSSAATGLNPEIMGLGPVEAVRKALGRAGMTVDDIDLFEINEAFAAQVLPSARNLGIPMDKLNTRGGSIALGHPFGMTGARIMTTLIHNLQETDKTFGVETMCVGGGQGMAMVIERLS